MERPLWALRKFLMNKIITMLLILVGVILIFAFNSLPLENGNVILYLICVFVIGFFGGGFSNLDNLQARSEELRFYEQLSARTKSQYSELVRKHEKLTLEKDELRLDAVRNFDQIFQELRRLKNER